MKIFDWDIAKKMHSPEAYDLLKNTYNKPISEEEFVQSYTNLPRNKKHASITRSPSSCKSHYRRLKKNFGFFK